MARITECVEVAVADVVNAENPAAGGRLLHALSAEVEAARTTLWKAKVKFVRDARGRGYTVAAVAEMLGGVSEGYVRRCHRGQRGPTGGD